MFEESLAQLERLLGDPHATESLCSWRTVVDHDERSEFPEAALQAITKFGLQRYLVPSALGGKLDNLEQAYLFLGVLARRDLTLAIGFGQTLLGLVPVWIDGSESLQKRAAEIVLAGKQGALALTERVHGADLLASDTSCVPMGEMRSLSGEKWLINNATRGAFLSVFARTGRAGDPRGYNIVFVDKERVAGRGFSTLPKIATHGIRGADISGVRIEGIPISDDAVIGSLGAGLESAHKALQVTRALCPALSWGALHTALQATIGFALGRSLYSRSVSELPLAKRTIGRGVSALLLIESLGRAGVRAAHYLPKEMTVTSAVSKYVGPMLSEKFIHELSTVLGARHYLRSDWYGGIFEKLMRDNALVSLFDGSSVINLYWLIEQIPLMSSVHSGADVGGLFHLGDAMSVFDWRTLVVGNRGRNSIAASEISESDPCARFLRLAQAELRDEIPERMREIAGKGGLGPQAPAAAFDLARRYALLQAGVVAARVAHDTPAGHVPSEWLACALGLLSDELGHASPARDEDFEALAEWAENRYRGGGWMSLSHVPIPDRPLVYEAS